MKASSREEIRDALIEELIPLVGSRRGSAAMVRGVETGDIELARLPNERARQLARRLIEKPPSFW